MSKLCKFFNDYFTIFSSTFIGTIVGMNFGGYPQSYSKGIQKEMKEIVPSKSNVLHIENNPVLEKEFYSLENLVKEKFERKKIPVLMFHRINESGKRYSVSPANFRYILDKLHRNDYFALSLEQFYTGNFSGIPVGKKPFLITFDDASKGQFEYINGKIDSDCAVGIMEDFFNNNRDFGRGAVFYESYFGIDREYIEPFNGDMKEKNDFLIEHGYNIGSHTVIHNNNRNATIKDIKEQTITMNALLQYHTDVDMNKQIRTYAHPYGAVPRDPFVKAYLESQHNIIMLATGGMSSHPLSKKFNPKEVPRIEADMTTFYAFFNRSEQYEISDMDSLYYEAKFNNKKPYFDVNIFSKPLANIPSSSIKETESKFMLKKTELPCKDNYVGNNDIKKNVGVINGE